MSYLSAVIPFRTKPQASVTCTKRTKTWRRILQREGKRQPGTRVLDNGKRKETWYDVQVMDSEERHPEKRMRESKDLPILEFHVGSAVTPSPKNFLKIQDCPTAFAKYRAGTAGTDAAVFREEVFGVDDGLVFLSLLYFSEFLVEPASFQRISLLL